MNSAERRVLKLMFAEAQFQITTAVTQIKKHDAMIQSDTLKDFTTRCATANAKTHKKNEQRKLRVGNSAHAKKCRDAGIPGNKNKRNGRPTS